MCVSWEILPLSSRTGHSEILALVVINLKMGHGVVLEIVVCDVVFVRFLLPHPLAGIYRLHRWRVGTSGDLDIATGVPSGPFN